MWEWGIASDVRRGEIRGEIYDCVELFMDMRVSGR